MSEELHSGSNGSQPTDDLPLRLAGAARALDYPPTPDLAARPSWAGRGSGQMPGRAPVFGRRLGVAAAACVAVLIGLLAVPGVRAGVLQFLQVGVVRIDFVATAEPAATAAATGQHPTLAADSVFGLAGHTSLEAAREQASFEIRLPAYPPGLGEPDDVFVPDPATVVSVWRQADDPSRARLSLFALAARGTFEALHKQVGTPVVSTHVNGSPAVWTTGPYTLRTASGHVEEVRLIDGHVLIWAEAGITYRLETSLPLEEAILIAESLR
jgi:hypothetical protein